MIFYLSKGKITWPSASSLEEILQIISIKKKKKELGSEAGLNNFTKGGTVFHRVV